MSEVVLDASAVLALLRDEPGADIVAGHMGNAAISAVNLQEVAKEMFREGASCADVRAILGGQHQIVQAALREWKKVKVRGLQLKHLR